jgi:hypothetical protein
VDAEGILKGLYRFHEGERGAVPAQILASGVAVPWAVEAQRILAEEWDVRADVWSATSWNELRREAVRVEEHNLLHPEEEQRVPYITRKLQDAQGPVLAVSDWMRSVPDQISRWVPATYQSLGADGFGFADTRGAARRFFHIDAQSIVLGVLTELAKANKPLAAVSFIATHSQGTLARTTRAEAKVILRACGVDAGLLQQGAAVTGPAPQGPARDPWPVAQAGPVHPRGLVPRPREEAEVAGALRAVRRPQGRGESAAA